MSTRKKVTLAKFNGRDKAGRELGIAKRQENAENDGMTSHERRVSKIEKAANGKWWVKQYLMGNMSFNEKEHR